MYGSEVLGVSGGVIHMLSLVMDEVDKVAFRARHLLSAQRRANNITVCINRDLVCIADAHCSQIYSGSHPFITFPPPSLMKGSLQQQTGIRAMIASPPAAHLHDFCASPFMKYHDIHTHFQRDDCTRAS